MKPRSPNQDIEGVYNRIVELWTLRLMVTAEHLPGIREVRESQAEYILELLGLGEAVSQKTDRRTLLTFIRQRLQKLEQDLPSREGVLFRNLVRLADRTGLNRTEQDLLAFSVLWPEHRLTKSCCEYVGEISSRRILPLLAGALGEEVSAIHKALQKDGVLRKTGLLCLGNV